MLRWRILGALFVASCALGCESFLDDYEVPHCGPNTILTEGGCAPVGVQDCGPPSEFGDAPLFARDAGGHCAAIVAEGCAGQTMAVLGEYRCVPIAACVAPGDLDGELVTSAQDVTTSTAAVFTLGGSLTGTLTLERANVTLQGTCPEAATVERLVIRAPGVVVKGLRARSISIEAGATDVTLRELWIDGDDAAPGITCQPTGTSLAKVTIERVVVEGTRGPGVLARGCDLDMNEIHIRAIRSNAGTLQAGTGIELRPLATFEATKASARLTAAGIVIEDVEGAGLRVRGGSVQLGPAFIRRIAPIPFEADLFGVAEGPGIDLERELSRGVATEALSLIEHTVVEQATGVGIRIAHQPRAATASEEGAADDSFDVRLRDTTVRATAAPAGRCVGHALRVVSHPGLVSRVEVMRSTFVDSVQTGVHVLGSQLTMSESLVRGVSRCGSERFGDAMGIYAQIDSSLVRPEASRVTGSRLDDFAGGGLVVMGDSDAVIRNSFVDPSRGVTGLVAASYQALGDDVAAGTGKIDADVTHCENASQTLALCQVEPLTRDPALVTRDEEGTAVATLEVAGKANVAEGVGQPVIFVRGRDEILGIVAPPEWSLGRVPSEGRLHLAGWAAGAQNSIAPWHAAAVAPRIVGFPAVAGFEELATLDASRGNVRVLRQLASGCGAQPPPPSTAFAIDGRAHPEWNEFGDTLLARNVAPGWHELSITQSASCRFVGCSDRCGATCSPSRTGCLRTPVLADEIVQVQVLCGCD